MARARNIKPGFFKNEELAECSLAARLCFAGLWTLADREGRLEDRPKRIKGELFAFDTFDVEPLLAELEARKFLVRYQNPDGSFIQISKFSAHQTPHYSEKPSVIKPPDFQESGGDEAGKSPGESSHEAPATPGTLQEDSKKEGVIKRGSQPPDSLIPDSPNPSSPKKRSGADAPPSVADKPLTDRDRVWALGVPLLGESARSLLGKLSKAHGESVLAAVLAEATLDKPLEPKAWVIAACEAKARPPPKNGHSHEPDDLLADPYPPWALGAGFSDRFQAENAGCLPYNAAKFRDGKRVTT